MGKLTGRTVLVTGASQGIDRDIVKTSARHDADLIPLDISDEIGKLADELAGRGHRCIAVRANARDLVLVEGAVTCAKQIKGKIDILVNNAGICRFDNFLGISDEDRDFRIDISTKGVRNMVRAVLPEMIARKGGCTVMMSSVIDDMVVDSGETVYALSKAATIGLAKLLAVECAQSGICANAIRPGCVRTPIAESIARQSNPEDPESVLVKMAEAIPMRRLVCSPEVGELAALLASNESSHLTGMQSVIDGGSTLPENVNVGI